MEYVISLTAITLLCAVWMAFQLWLKRVDPQRENYKPGCGACQGGACAAKPATNTTTIAVENISGEAHSHPGGKVGEHE